MKLEAEFRVRLQLQQLERTLSEFSLPSQPPFTPSTWVKLLELPSPMSGDEALLLCQCSESQWLAWVPDYGEVVLELDQFCSLI